MKISKNFQLYEFIRSDIAARRGYRVVPDKWVTEQIERLVATLLQPIRDELGVPIRITSGYRPPWLNRMVNGSTNSAHLFGCAADIEPIGMTLPMAFKRIKDMGLLADQVILENPPTGWIHVGQALPGRTERKQYMTATFRGDRIVYENA